MSTASMNAQSTLLESAKGAGESSQADREALLAAPARKQTVSKGRIVTGRVLSTLAVLFLLFDAYGKIAQPRAVLEASARIAFPVHLLFGIGILLLACTALYAILRTAVLGAVLLTGYLGGAGEVQLTVGSPTFETIFPVLSGILVWAGIFLREQRLFQLLPLRCMGR
ncbi:MAG: DoxX family protein [Terracidiphilus sp.]|jgi:hypothetical protein